LELAENSKISASSNLPYRLEQPSVIISSRASNPGSSNYHLFLNNSIRFSSINQGLEVVANIVNFQLELSTKISVILSIIKRVLRQFLFFSSLYNLSKSSNRIEVGSLAFLLKLSIASINSTPEFFHWSKSYSTGTINRWDPFYLAHACTKLVFPVPFSPKIKIFLSDISFIIYYSIAFFLHKSYPVIESKSTSASYPL